MRIKRYVQLAGYALWVLGALWFAACLVLHLCGIVEITTTADGDIGKVLALGGGLFIAGNILQLLAIEQP